MDKPRFCILTPLFDELRGERVIVRPYRLEDAAALQEAVTESREHIRPWLPFADHHQTIEETQDWITRQTAKWLLREDLGVGIWEIESGRYLGGSGLHVRSWDEGYFEIGYWLRKSAEGHGYVLEAVRLLVDFAFGPFGANRLEILCDERNERSAAVARRLGFRQEGLLRNDSRSTDGSLRNTLVFGLIPSDVR